MLTRAVREHRDRRLAEEQKAALAAEEARREAELEHERRPETRIRKGGKAFQVVVSCVGVGSCSAAVSGGVAWKARNNANARFRDVTAEWLYGHSQLMLAGKSPFGSDDTTAMQTVLAANAIASTDQRRSYDILTVLNQERDLVKIIDLRPQLESVAFSSDGSRIAAAAADGTVVLRNAATGAPIGQPMRGHDGWVNSVALSPDGSRVVSGGDDATVRIWTSTAVSRSGNLSPS